jgi:S1-C subfamily serine protease
MSRDQRRCVAESLAQPFCRSREMKLIVCPSCEKKLKVPDSILAKGSFKCPACGQTLKFPKPKPKDDEDDLVELEADDAIADEVIDEDVVDNAFLEDDDSPRRRPAKPARKESGTRPAKKASSGSKAGVVIGLGVGVLMAIVGFAVATWLFSGKKADNQVAQQNPAPINVVPPNSPSLPNGMQPPPAANGAGVPGLPSPTPSDPAAPAVPINPAPQVPNPVPAPVAPMPNPMPQLPAPGVPVQPPPAVAANPNNALRYKWQPNREYSYKFNIEANLGDIIERTEGVCSYRVSPQPAGPSVEFKQQGTGTAFVVTTDGFLVTCAHVVDSAKTIEVHLGGVKYPAVVVSSDRIHDVAVIRINAQNLSPVPLTDSNNVQLGQHVRALGYPLSDVLGNNLKVTSGSVSGLNQEANSRVFQVDAAINPGNSGGPIVNEMGEVIGVASAKLTGPTVTNVGMARPINDVKTLLLQAGAKFVSGTSQQKLDGPALAAKVSPSVALVSVVGGASGNRITLNYDASFSTSQRPAPGKRFLNMSFPTLGRGSGTLTIDEFGEIVQLTGEEQLPFCMGPVGLVAIAPLNPTGQATWGRTEQTSVTRIEQDPNDPLARMRARGMMRPPFGPPGGFPGGPFGNKPKETVFPAQETTSFTLGQQVADVQLLKKSYELKTLDNVNNPYLHLKGEGDWRFHVKDAMPFSAELKFELARNIENATIRVPFQMNFLYTDPQIIAAERKVNEERIADARKQQSEKAASEIEKLASPKKAKRVRRFAPLSTIIAQAIQLTPDGKRALVSTHEGPILIFDANSDEPIGTLEGLKQNIQFLSVSNDGKLVAGGTLTEACVWNLDSKQVVLQPKIDRFAPSCATFSADNQRAYFGFVFIRFQGWDLGTGKLLNDWQPKTGNTKAVTLTPDGQTLIATDGQQLLHYDPTTGNLQKTEPLAPGGGSYFHARFSADGRHGLFVKSLSSLDVVSLTEPTKPINIAVRPSPNNSFAISANGKRVAVADSSNKQVVVWDVEKNQLIDQWPVDTIAAQTVALSADGKFVLTCGHHKVLQLWEITE